MENIKKINFNDSVFINFISKGHLIGHIGIGVTEGIVAGILYFASIAVSGPVGWGIAIGIHAFTALSTFIYDKTHKNKNLIENMKDFEKNLLIQLDCNKEKIETIMLNMKRDTENEIERFVDSQNSDFKMIKKHKSEYDKIYSDFKQICISMEKINM